MKVAAPDAEFTIPFQPFGQAYDMGRAPDGTPLIDPRLFDTREFQRNPYPYYRIMRDHYPVYHDRLHNAYYLTRYWDVTQAYMDDEGFNTIPKGSSNAVLGNVQHELSGVEHRRRRNMYGQHLVGESLKARIPAIEKLAAEMILRFAGPVASELVEENISGRRTVELGKAFADEFPVRVVCQVLGFPEEARSRFYHWYTSMMRGLGASESALQGIRAHQEIADFVGELIPERRKNPTYLYDQQGNVMSEDIISKLSRSELDGDLLSVEEVSSNIVLIVAAGGDTTRGAIMNMWFQLLTHPEQFRAVQDDPSLFQTAIHETLRFSSSVGGQPRHTSYDVTMHGVTIPAGSLVNCVDFSASHDERVFKEPETFNLFRDDLYSGKLLRNGHHANGRHNHMAFGVGPHMCPGAWISVQESILGSEILLKSLKNPSINWDRQPKDLAEPEKLAQVGTVALRELWLDFDPA
ncbi:MAG: cytochrome P450 [Dehalococcoidia bacterium]